MDRELTTRAELLIPLYSLDYSYDHFLFGCVAVCAAAPHRELRRAWREEPRRCFVAKRLFRPQYSLVLFYLGISVEKVYRI